MTQPSLAVRDPLVSTRLEAPLGQPGAAHSPGVLEAGRQLSCPQRGCALGNRFAAAVYLPVINGLAWFLLQFH